MWPGDYKVSCSLMHLFMFSPRGWEGFLTFYQIKPRQPGVQQPRGEGGGGSHR